MVYILMSGYSGSNAADNRILGWSHGLFKLGINHNLVVGVYGELGKNINIDVEVPIIRLFYRQCFNSSIINKITRRIQTYLIFKKKLINFLKALQPNDIVYYYKSKIELDILLEYRDKIGYKLYLERTEHPTIGFNDNKEFDKFIRNCRRVDRLFVIQDKLKNSFISHGIPEEKITVLNMTVDPRRFVNLEKQEQETPYIAYCGTLYNNKDGVDDLIKSFKIVSDKFPNLKLYIVGSYPLKNEREGNMKLIDKLNLRDKIVLTGLVSSAEIPKILKNADILVLARPNNLQAQNGFPTKLGEYLMTGNPVVVTKTGLIDNFLTHNINALLAEPSNIEDIANKIIWALENRERSKAIGCKGKEVALKSFNCFEEAKKIQKYLY